ncbi:MAG: enoyl-CoA hydratase/isomerase family protein [Solirubrobacterales bacterium]
MSELHASGKLILDRPAEAVARIRICNPPKRGALDHEILDGLAELVPSLDRGIDTRCLVVTGTERMFSSGYDIGDIPEEVFAQEAERLVAQPFSRAIEAVERFSFPTLAAINGHALGGGLELALSCDLRVAASEAKLGMPPAKLGLIYSHTGLHKFIDTIGAARTREMFFVGRNVPAPRAEQFGLVNEVFAGDQLESKSIELAAEIATNAPLSLKGNKRIINSLISFARLSEQQQQELIDLRLSSFASDDFREGVSAFGQKRKAIWRGR